MPIDRDVVCIGLEKLAQSLGVTLNQYVLEDLTKSLSARLEDALKDAEEEKFDQLIDGLVERVSQDLNASHPGFDGDTFRGRVYLALAEKFKQIGGSLVDY